MGLDAFLIYDEYGIIYIFQSTKIRGQIMDLTLLI